MHPSLRVPDGIVCEQGMGGIKKDIRVLLSTLHTVLWPGAKWEEVTISKLIDVGFLRCVALGHCDVWSIVMHSRLLLFVASSVGSLEMSVRLHCFPCSCFGFTSVCTAQSYVSVVMIALRCLL